MVVERRVEPVRCSWCGKIIWPGESWVKFPCPNCGRVLIIRCERCRKLVRPYKCVHCGFMGP
ncbi:DUF1610 domain-containing protein [archaeon]|nr:DUF1610 domain-containing protein [archaeon]